jgi:hypothetical protein
LELAKSDPENKTLLEPKTVSTGEVDTAAGPPESTESLTAKILQLKKQLKESQVKTRLANKNNKALTSKNKKQADIIILLTEQLAISEEYRRNQAEYTEDPDGFIDNLTLEAYQVFHLGKFVSSGPCLFVGLS